MKYCEALNGSLNIERDRVHFCVAVKQNMPTIPWNPDEDLPVDLIRRVRDALIRELNGDLDKPIAEYVAHGSQGSNSGHPCRGCRHIIEVNEDFPGPTTDKLTCYLHLQAFTYCNAKCSYCNLRLDEGRTPLSRGRDLDIAVYKAVRQLFDAGAIAPTCRVIFSSGEPSLSKEGMETLSLLTKNNLNTLINTNAIWFAPEIEEALKAGRAHVQLSLESGDRQSYIDVKGVDKFDSVVKNVDRYLAAVRGNSVFWLKYIIFSKTNSRDNMDSFIDFCKAHHIPNVVVSANYNEGEAVSLNCLGDGTANKDDAGSEIADIDSLKAFGYLTTQLELLGVNVHKEYAHLTENEQVLAKTEYARAVAQALKFTPEDTAACIPDIIEGQRLLSLTEDSSYLKNHMTTLLRKSARDSKGIGLFGAGAHACWISSVMGEIGIQPVVAFDNNPRVEKQFDFPVARPDDISLYDIDTVIIASNAYHLPIYDQLSRTPAFSKVRIIDPYLNP